MEYQQSTSTVEQGDAVTELLLFYLGSERYGIDITHIKEVIPRPAMTQVPHAHPAVCGVMHLRGAAVTVIELQQAIGEVTSAEESASVIVTELAGNRQGMLVSQVDRIVYCKTSEFSAPPSGIGHNSYIEEVVRHEDGLIQLLDFDKVLSSVLNEYYPEESVA